MRIVLGVSGGIAAYKACSLLRRFTESGHEVTVVPTAASLNFVGEATWAALSGRPAQHEVFEQVHEVPHVRLGQAADLVVVAPATADVIAKAAHGMADDLLTNTLLTARCPVVVAPAMHTEMWLHPATQANVATLRERGVHVMDPASGRLTGADTGPGRLAEPDDIAAYALAAVGGSGAEGLGEGGAAGLDTASASAPAYSTSAAGASAYSTSGGGAPASSTSGGGAGLDTASASAPAYSTSVAGAPAYSTSGGYSTSSEAQDLAGCRVLISAGGTREALDPVRYLGNRSSGKQGYALAADAAARGARVTLVSTTERPAPAGVEVVAVESALELRDAMLARAADADAVVMAAAVADFRPAERATSKIKKTHDPADPEAAPTIELVRNPDILVELVRQRGPASAPVIVGFAAETGDEHGDLLSYAREKLERKGCDLLVANEVGDGVTFGQDVSTVHLLRRGSDDVRTVGPADKSAVAAAVWDAVVAMRAAP